MEQKAKMIRLLLTDKEDYYRKKEERKGKDL